jgi:hypothetical protein
MSRGIPTPSATEFRVFQRALWFLMLFALNMPPHPKDRDRSLPVPRGMTETAGCGLILDRAMLCSQWFPPFLRGLLYRPSPGDAVAATVAALNIQPSSLLRQQYLGAEQCFCAVHCAFNCSWMFLVHYPHVLDPPEPQRYREQVLTIARQFNI